MIRRLSTALVASCLAAPPVLGQTAGEPVDGTVFIRTVGAVQALRGDDPRLRREVLLGLSDVPVATGSGFIVSPDGWIVTNLHVVNDERRVVLIDNEKVDVAVNVQRIEVVVPAGRGEPQRFVATVSASDPELDLALLYVSAQNLPYVPLGDSDAIAPGDAVRALGYPFGAQLEIGRTPAAGDDPAPGITVSAGTVSSLRRDNAGDIRYVQTTAQLNPGNSGGPMVDADGFAVAVAQLEVGDGKGSGVGFGIPVNLLKEFLRRHALDSRLPAQMVELGGYLEAPSKGLRLRLPYGLADQSPFRLRVDTSPAESALALRIERLSSPRSLDQVEQALLQEGAFERFRAAGLARRMVRTVEDRRVIDGYVTGSDPTTGRRMSAVYALLDVGRERVVARYIGTAEAVALNRSVLHASLASLEAAPLLTAEVAEGVPGTWMSVAASGASTTVPVPEGWLVEPGTTSSCGALPEPSFGFTASPSGDFTVQFRAAWRPGPPADLPSAARACAPDKGTSGSASYAATFDWWGAPYRVEGAMVASTGGTWHLEVLAPRSKMPFVLPAFAAWSTVFVP